MTMQAIAITAPGGPDVLATTHVPRPAPGPQDVLIEVYAAGVNRPDCLQRAGRYPLPPGASPLPGLEVAGTVSEVGARVTQWRTGDAVMALTHGGGYAQFCVADQGHCLPVPSGLSWVEAAAIPETTFTVVFNVLTRAALQPGERLLVHGGASGIGTTAIQIANALGCEVAVTAGNEEKLSVCRALGARHALSYRGDWPAELANAWPEGLDVVLDMVGGNYVAPNLAALRQGGRYALIALIGGAQAECFDLAAVLRRHLTVFGTTLRPQSVAHKRTIARTLSDRILPLFEAGSVVPIVTATFPMAQASDAHTLMESGEHFGKIVLEVRTAQGEHP